MKQWNDVDRLLWASCQPVDGCLMSKCVALGKCQGHTGTRYKHDDHKWFPQLMASGRAYPQQYEQNYAVQATLSSMTRTLPKPTNRYYLTEAR